MVKEYIPRKHKSFTPSGKFPLLLSHTILYFSLPSTLLLWFLVFWDSSLPIPLSISPPFIACIYFHLVNSESNSFRILKAFGPARLLGYWSSAALPFHFLSIHDDNLWWLSGFHTPPPLPPAPILCPQQTIIVQLYWNRVSLECNARAGDGNGKYVIQRNGHEVRKIQVDKERKIS